MEIRSGTPRMAHSHPCTGIPRRSRPIPDNAFRNRGRVEVPQSQSCISPARNRDIYLGCPAGQLEDRRHRRLRLPRAGVGAGTASLRLVALIKSRTAAVVFEQQDFIAKLAVLTPPP